MSKSDHVSFSPNTTVWSVLHPCVSLQGQLFCHEYNYACEGFCQFDSVCAFPVFLVALVQLYWLTGRKKELNRKKEREKGYSLVCLSYGCLKAYSVICGEEMGLVV